MQFHVVFGDSMPRGIFFCRPSLSLSLLVKHRKRESPTSNLHKEAICVSLITPPRAALSLIALPLIGASLCLTSHPIGRGERNAAAAAVVLLCICRWQQQQQQQHGKQLHTTASLWPNTIFVERAGEREEGRNRPNYPHTYYNRHDC